MVGLKGGFVCGMPAPVPELTSRRFKTTDRDKYSLVGAQEEAVALGRKSRGLQQETEYLKHRLEVLA